MGQGFVRTLAAFKPEKPLRAKLELVWAALDIDQNGTLSDDEVGRIARECHGAEADKVRAQSCVLCSSQCATCWKGHRPIANTS